MSQRAMQILAPVAVAVGERRDRLPLPPRLTVAHSGKQHAYRHALAVHRAGCLDRFVTSSYYKPDLWPDCVFTRMARLDRPLRRRWIHGLPSDRVTRRWSLELPELLARNVMGNGTRASELVLRRDAKFDRWVARRFAAQSDMFWGFQGSCLESLNAARQAGKVSIAEFATAHVIKAVQLLSVEAERHPEWAESISNYRFPGWYQDRLEQEPHQADVCIAASEFTRQSLIEAGVDADRIRLLPLGADLSQFHVVDRSHSGRFRFLFVGGVGQRKGIKYLLNAYRRIRSPNTELVIVGPVNGAEKALDEYRSEITLLGRLDQDAVVRQMQMCHALVLPSVFEGFGLVIPEAMATGMPVIASTHSIGPEIIREGVDGFVLRPDDVEGLAARMDLLVNDRERCRAMGREAAIRAQDFSWTRHADRVAALIHEIWDNYVA